MEDSKHHFLCLCSRMYIEKRRIKQKNSWNSGKKNPESEFRKILAGHKFFHKMKEGLKCFPGLWFNVQYRVHCVQMEMNFFLIILSCSRHLSVSLGEAAVNRDKCNLSALQWHGIKCMV